MSVIFEGLPPFDLGLAQRVSAQSSNGSVEMTLYVVLPEHGALPQPIRVRMGYRAAADAATLIFQAAVEAELKRP
jgi:hypothetical protein